jgi:hypothetical protein
MLATVQNISSAWPSGSGTAGDESTYRTLVAHDNVLQSLSVMAPVNGGDVRGVPLQATPGRGHTHRGTWVGTRGGFLDVPQRPRGGPPV